MKYDFIKVFCEELGDVNYEQYQDIAYNMIQYGKENLGNGRFSKYFYNSITDAMKVVNKKYGKNHILPSEDEELKEELRWKKEVGKEQCIFLTFLIMTMRKKEREKGKVQAIAMDDIAVTVPIDADVSVYQTSVTCNDTASAPVAAGDELGKITVTDGDGNTVYTTSLFANTDVAASTAEEIAVMKKEAQITLLKEIIFGAALAVLGFLILLCITRTIGKYQYKKRRKQRRHRQKNHMAASSRNPIS